MRRRLNTARGWTEALAARAALAVLRRLGPIAASNLGGWAGRCIGPLLPVSRVADRNLRLALPELDAPARRRVVRGVWDNLGRTVAELPHLAALGPTDHGPGWEIEGDGHLRALAARGGPAIFFSGHIGNWEVLPPAAARFGIPIASVYRPAANRRVDALLRDLRATAAGHAIGPFPKGATGARQTLAHLSAGGFLGLLIDQKMNDGIAVPLFGHAAMTAPAAAAFALRFGCPLLPSHVRRLGPARFRVVCEPPLTPPDTGDRHADIAALTGAMNACIERWVRARPDSWLWLHRRWPPEAYARLEPPP